MDRKIKAIIIDDLPLAIANLKAELEDHHPEIIIAATAGGVIEGAKKIKEHKPDLIFLDIEMGDGDGFDLLEISDHSAIQVIFTTASKDHAIKAFQFSALDYLLKPIDPSLLAEAIKKYKTHNQQNPKEAQTNDTISLSTQEEIRVVKLVDILRLESDGNYTKFHLIDNKVILVAKTLKEYESQLGDKFLRVHQSHLVNRSHITSYKKSEGGALIMSDGYHVPVSFRKRSYVIEQLSK